MKPDIDYTKVLLDAMEASEGPTFDITDLKNCGLDSDDPQFLFHMRLLVDDHYIETESGGPGCGYTPMRRGGIWNVVPLRLTRSGHDAARLLSKPSTLEKVRSSFSQYGFRILRQASDLMMKEGMKQLVDGM